MHSMNDYSSAIQLRSDRWSALRAATTAMARDPKSKGAAQGRGAAVLREMTPPSQEKPVLP